MRSMPEVGSPRRMNRWFLNRIISKTVYKVHLGDPKGLCNLSMHPLSHLTALVMCLSKAIDGVPNSPINIVSRPEYFGLPLCFSPFGIATALAKYWSFPTNRRSETHAKSNFPFWEGDGNSRFAHLLACDRTEDQRVRSALRDQPSLSCSWWEFAIMYSSKHHDSVEWHSELLAILHQPTAR